MSDSTPAADFITGLETALSDAETGVSATTASGSGAIAGDATASGTGAAAGDGTTTVDNSATGNAAGTKSTTTTGKTTKNAR